MLTKDKLDTPICDFEEGAKNTQTPREFIKESEKEFGLIPKDLDSMTDKHLNDYLDFLDYLWEK